MLADSLSKGKKCPSGPAMTFLAYPALFSVLAFFISRACPCCAESPGGISTPENRLALRWITERNT